MKANEVICEHVSRQARRELVKLLRGRLGSETAVAASVGVTEMAVRKWLSGLTHPSNLTLRKLLERVFELDEKGANEVLERDFEEFSRALRAGTQKPPRAELPVTI